MSLLTHIKLPDEACNVTMFEVKWQNFFSKPPLLVNMETFPALKAECNEKTLKYYQYQDSSTVRRVVLWIGRFLFLILNPALHGLSPPPYNPPSPMMNRIG